MKSILISIQPYWCFLIIAKTMCWEVDQEKTIEVRKNFPKDEFWNKKVIVYCSKDKRSFNKIPKEYQPLMEKFLGKVIGEFKCYEIEEYTTWLDDYHEYEIDDDTLPLTCLTREQLYDYGKGETIYGWHISDLKIYDDPKELSELTIACHCFNRKNLEIKENVFNDYVVQYFNNSFCRICKYYNSDFGDCDKPAFQPLKRPPQSWCYVE